MCSLHGTCAERSTIQHLLGLIPQTFFSFATHISFWLFLFLFFSSCLIFQRWYANAADWRRSREGCFYYLDLRNRARSWSFLWEKDVWHCASVDLYRNVVPMTCRWSLNVLASSVSIRASFCWSKAEVPPVANCVKFMGHPVIANKTEIPSNGEAAVRFSLACRFHKDARALILAKLLISGKTNCKPECSGLELAMPKRA